MATIKAPVEIEYKSMSFRLAEDVCELLDKYAVYIDRRAMASDRRLSYLRSYVVSQAVIPVLRDKKFQQWLEQNAKADKQKGKDNGA